MGFRKIAIMLAACAASGAVHPAIAAAPLAQAAAPAAEAMEPEASDPVHAAIDAHFLAFQRDSHVPGLVWGIVENGELIHFGSSGVQDLETQRPVGPDSLFRIASMSKAFTALAILKLRDEGRLTLDDPAEMHVPELRGWTYPTADSPRIRVRDLLHHLAGFVTDDPWGDRQQPLSDLEFTRMLTDGVPFNRPPGIGFEYSNFGYALLGRIVTNASGRPYDQYIMSEIMRPIGMASTGYEIGDAPPERRALGYRWENDAHSPEPDMAHGAFGAMGGVQTDAADYAKWIAFLLDGWPPRDTSQAGPVRRSTRREIVQGANFARTGERPALPGDEACTYAIAYGMGLRVSEDCDLGLTAVHGGGYPGYGSYMMLLPEKGVGLFAFANRTYAAPVAPVYQAALELFRAARLADREIPVSESLGTAYAAAGAMYSAASVEPGRDLLAMNFLMDRSAENWAGEFARLREQVGACATDADITPSGRLTGTFLWRCERGSLRGQLLLAPTEPAGIQALRFSLAPNP